MNEILLYSALDEYSAGQLIYQLSWIGENQVYAIRIYCPGGDVEAAWGIPAKMQELKQKGCHSIAKVDGMAASIAGVLLCFFDEREALDVSNIMLHRAAYAEKDNEGRPLVITPEEKQFLAKINADLKSKMLQIIDDGKLKALKGISVSDLFDEKKERINCWLNANEAMQIGLITKVIPIDANSSQYMVKAVAACYGSAQRPEATAATAGNNQTNAKKMTAEEFQKENPEEFKKIQDSAAAEAKKAYRTEVQAALGIKERESGDAGNQAGGQLDKAAISAIVEETLKAVGKISTEGNQPPQTAAATAAQAAQSAQAEAEKKAKAEADKKVADDLKKDIEDIKSGRK
jgi:ATP-dependent protease ClpP protease subunit